MGSFNDEYLKLRKKRQEEQEEDYKSSVPYQRPLKNSAAVPGNSYRDKVLSGDVDDIAPVKEKEKDRKWFEQGAFEDGYQFGDLFKTASASAQDLKHNVAAGILGIGEKVVDAGAYVAGGVGGLLGADKFKDNMQEFVKKDLYNEENVAKKLIDISPDAIWGKMLGVDEEKDSVFGEKTDALAQSGGQLLGTIGLQAAGVPWWVTSGVTSFGSETENAFNQGATYGEAGVSATISMGAEILTEKMFGGSGLGEKGLINLEPLTKGISSKVVKVLADYGVDMLAEGSEEVVSSVFSRLGSTLYKEENIGEILASEEAFDEYLESFIGGMALGGVANVGNVPNSIKSGTDYRTGLTSNEQAVIDKVYNDRIADEKLTSKEKSKIYDEVIRDFEKGYISTDIIEEVLGGEDYTNYQSELKRQQDIDNELNELRNMKSGDMTDIQIERMAELKGMKPNTELVNSLKFGIDEKIRNSIQGSRLVESYNERARRGQAFEADLSQYDAKQAEVIKKAIESGILNNTNRTHEFVDMVAKISADKGVLFDFANNAKLKESGFGVNGKFVNGYVTKDGITVNIDSQKSLNSVVGHEITHVLEGTELYNALQNTIIEYAKSKGDYQSRIDTLTKLYEGVEGADVNAELTADLVGDYLFTDSDFINHLSTTNRNVFQKIYDEIKYLYKVATAGSKQARELEKVKRALDKAYRESGKAEGTKYSLSDSKGNKLTQEQADFFKDSKIRDKDGNILKVYHSTDAKFTVFDKAKIGSGNGGANFGKGFYFATYSDLASDYGENIGAYYLNIKNPFEYYAIDKQALVDLLEKSGYEYDKEFVESYDEDNLWDADLIDDFLGEALMGKNPYAVFSEMVQKAGYDGIWAGEEIVAFEPNQIKRIDNTKPTDNPDIRYSISDSEGKKLTKEQSEYFKDSKMRDDNGNLKVMYHGSQDAGFHIFDPAHSDDETSLFFVDRNDVAASYSGTSETYEAQSIRSAADMNNFIESIGAEGYEVVKKDGKFILLYEGDRVADSNTAEGIYEEFCWYEGVGEGDANYKVYLNLVNPLVVDAEGRNWNNISREYSQEIADRYHSLNADERAALVNLAEWGEYSIFKDEMLEARANAEQGVGGVFDEAYTKNLARAYEKLGGANANLYDAFSIASDNFSEESIKQFAVKQMNTRDYAQKAKAEGYDGVIFKNIVDVGGYSNGDEGASTVAIAFESNQIKSVANDKPTVDKDIRYSLTEYTAEEKKAHNDMVLEHFGKTYKWAETGYLLLDGTRLDLSGKHDGAAGGYRTVDHRDITEALGYDYGGGDYSGSLIQFMSEGNIRIIPESNGINLSVKPTKAQEQALADFISRYRGEMMLDIDDLNGNTVVSVEYPKGTYYVKILNDIREWFENGKKPEVANRYPFFSLSDTNETPKKYGNYNVYGKDIRLPGKEAEDIAPVGVAENAITTEETISEIETVDYPEGFAPVINSYTIEQELDEIQTQIDALVEEGTALYNNGEEAKAMELMEKINELSNKARSLTERANTLKAQEEAERKAYMDSITDADMPLEAERAYSEAETTPLDEKTLKKLTKGVRDILSCMPKESKEIREVIEKYSTSNQSKSELFKELREKFGDKYEYHRYSDIAEAKKHLKNTKFTVSDHVKGDIADYRDYKKLHGVRESRNALPVDIVYEELSELFPGVFSPEIANETDRFERISEVMATPTREWVKVAELSDNEIMQAVDFIHNEVVGYRNNESRKATEANARAYIDDIAPSRASEITKNVSDPTLNYQGIHRETPIKTVKERIAEKLSNVETELADNKRLRADSVVDFNREIARLQEEYNAKENKNTKVANNILRRIESLQRMKNNVDADYEKRISDLEAKKAKLSEEGRTGTSATEQSIMRAELHLSKIDDIRAKFAEKGLDFDETLKKAKNLSTFATVDNTPQRVMEKSLGYREGQILADETVNKVAQNETEGIKWLNSYTDRKNGLIAQISRQYNIKPGTKESAAAQMYAEGFYVNKDNEIIKYGDNELAMDFPDTKVQANIKGLARDTRIRQIYDETLDMINESRARNAYPEIQKLDNYFLHFRAMDDTFSRLGLPFNPNDIRAKDLPTDLNGVTADLKPGQPYFASAKHREGIKTSYDLLGGLERYLSSAKNQIYHIDDIQTLRALRNHIADTYGQAKGLEDLDSLSEAEAQERIKEVFDGHLSTFAKFLHEEANVIAGKTALIDRGLEGVIGRRGMTFMNTLNQQVGANMVGFNVSSSLTNVLPVVQAFAKTNKAAFVKGFAQTVSNKLGSIAGKTDGFAENSPVMIRRKGAERFYRTPFQKVGDAGYVLMSAVDDISTEIIARAKYNELTAKGMSADQAHVETDKWVSRLMGDRSLGQMPQLYNSKTLGIITKFQLEVRNQLDSQFYDTIQETKADNADIENALERNSKTAAKVALVFTELAIAQHLFGKAFESIAGYNPAFDIIEVLMTALGFDDEEESEDTALDNIEQGFLALLEDLPYTSTFTGGRIPLSSALPITELIKGEDEYGNEKSRLETLGEIAPYYVLPGGYGQAKKTIQGLSMFSGDHPIAGSYTDSGNLRFPVDDTLANKVQAGIFGQWASENARDYFDNERAPLNEKQTQEFIDVGMTIQDYWKYREGLSQYKTLAEKADYIYSLDLTNEQKNVLINNIADREEDIDMSDYGNYGSFEEFDYANKYPEKYEFWKQNGISYEDYASGDEDTKAAYNWAFEYPDKFTLSKAVASNVVTYRQYTKELYDIKADKDEDGKSIVGSRKEKVIDYVNNLDADYGAKIILFKSEYPADDTYNYDIIDYLNSRDDITYKEMETILKELGFTVDSQGNITWD